MVPLQLPARGARASEIETNSVRWSMMKEAQYCFLKTSKRGKETQLMVSPYFSRRLLSPHLVRTSQERYLPVQHFSLYSQGPSAPSGSTVPTTFLHKKIPPVLQGIPASHSLHLLINMHARGYQTKGHSSANIGKKPSIKQLLKQ